MKKLISLLVAASLLISCFVFSDFSAYAYTIVTAPEYKVGDKFNVNLSVKGENGCETEWKNSYFAKFTPEADGDYEFDVSKLDFYGEGGYSALIVDENDNAVSYGYALGEDSFYIDLVGHLKKGKTYYYLIHYSASVERTVKLTVTLKKHEHIMINTESESPDAEYMLDATDENGNYIDMCKVQGCYDSGLNSYYSYIGIKPSTPKCVYNGREQKPEPVCFDRRGKLYTPDHKLNTEYDNNIEIGTATMFVDDGDILNDAEFQIVPPAPEIAKLTPKKHKAVVKWQRQKYTSGYQVQYSNSSDFKKNNTKTVTLGFFLFSRYRAKHLESGEYYFRVRGYKKVEGKKYYSPWSETQSVIIM